MNDMSGVPASVETTLGIGKHKHPRWRRRLIWAAVILVVLYIGYSMFAGGGAKPVGFRKIAVKDGPLIVRVSATGKLEPVDKVDVGAEISGRLLEVDVDFGDHVTKGEKLARISTEEYDAEKIQADAQLLAAKAAVTQAEASLEDAQRASERANGLAKTRNISQQQVDEAHTALDRATAGLAVAKAQVSIADAGLQVIMTNITKAQIVSPIDGIVLDRAVEPGQTVAASFQTPLLFTLASDLKKLELKAEIDEADIGQVLADQNATFTVDAFPNRTFDAKIEDVRPGPKKNDPNSGSGNIVQGVVVYEAVLSVNNDDGLLRPGLTATADVTVRTVDKALQVPNGALRFTPPDIEMAEAEARDKAEPGSVQIHRDASKGRVFTLGGDGKPMAHEITLGATDGQYTEVLSGDLKDGDEVLTGMALAGSGSGH